MKIFIPLVALLVPVSVWAQPLISATAPVLQNAPNPLQVLSVSVVLSGTTGFARDAALEQAARQALPKVLQTEMFGLSATEATAKTKALGAVLPFVARYNIVTERVVPVYSLVADLTFNEAKLRQNFGGVATPLAPAAASVTGTTPAPAPATHRWLVRITEPSAAGQDRARRALAALPNTRVTIYELARAELTFAVMTPQPEASILAVLKAWQPNIMPQPEAPAPVAIDTTPSPAEPATPAAPPRTTPAWLPDFW